MVDRCCPAFPKRSSTAPSQAVPPGSSRKRCCRRSIGKACSKAANGWPSPKKSSPNRPNLRPPLLTGGAPISRIEDERHPDAALFRNLSVRYEVPLVRSSHARLAMTPPVSDSRDHAGQSPARAAVPAPSGRFGVVPCVATTRQRSRATRARHLFAWECPSSGTADRNPARTHLRDPKGPHLLVTKPEGHFPFLRANWTVVTAEGPTQLRFPVISCSKFRLGSKIGKPYRQSRPDRRRLSHIINNLSGALDRQKPTSSHVAAPKIRTSDVQNNAGLRIRMGNGGAEPPANLNFSNTAAIYRQYHCRSARDAYH